MGVEIGAVVPTTWQSRPFQIGDSTYAVMIWKAVDETEYKSAIYDHECQIIVRLSVSSPTYETALAAAIEASRILEAEHNART